MNSRRMLGLASSTLFSCAIVLRSPSRPDATLIAASRIKEPRRRRDATSVIRSAKTAFNDDGVNDTLVITNFRMAL